jgi:hypothetical protein
MTFEEIIYDILEIKNAINDDSDLEEMWVLEKFNRYRAINMASEFALTNEINYSWLQRMHKFSFEKINAADDPAIEVNSMTIGKAIIPQIVSLPEDQGIIRIAGSGVLRQFELCDFNSFIMKGDIDNPDIKEFGYCTRLGTVLYCYPYIPEGSAVIIAYNPLEVQINDNGTIRDMELSDPYPVCAMVAQKSIINILQVDMGIKDGTIMDIINDGQSKLNILKDYEGLSKTNSR